MYLVSLTDDTVGQMDFDSVEKLTSELGTEGNS